MNEIQGKRQEDGRERVARVVDALKATDLAALIATLPTHVLMLTGYWPVIGTGFALFTRDGEIAVLAPEDEKQFAEQSWANRIRTFSPSKLDTLTTPAIAAGEPLRALLKDMKLDCARLGYEYGAASEPSSYAGMNLYGMSVLDVIRNASPSAPLAPASELLGRLNSSKTPAEVQRVRLSCNIAAKSFERGRKAIKARKTEADVAAEYRKGFSVFGLANRNVQRADGFAWCMSGPNSAEAGAAFACSRNRKLQDGDMVLLHANNYADGYWTDITRTQTLGEPDEKQRKIYSAIAEARQAAFAAIKPGAKCSAVDQAAREVIAKHGFAGNFPHSLGHGVGFAAISANARPRIHPASGEVLETGMTFNVEPAVYIHGYGGARHCDVVAVTNAGMELLTNFQNDI